MAISIYFRHNAVRNGQKQLIADVTNCINDSKHLVAHAPTGLGKTDSALAPAMKQAVENDLDVFFCTPKISQHKIAVDVVRETAQKYELNVSAVDFVGKKHMCTDESLESLGSDEFYEMCRKRKKDEKCPYYAHARGHGLLQKAQAKTRISKAREWHSNAKYHSELVDYCKTKSLCAYETALQIGEKSKIVICDYHHILNPFISDALLGRTDKKIEDSIVIIDEAHNAPDRMRSALSVAIDGKTLARAVSEAALAGNEPLAKQLDRVIEAFKKAEDELDSDERVCYKNELPQYGADFLTDLYDTGLNVLESGRYRSHCLHVLHFYEQWLKDSEAFLRIIKRSKYGAKIYYKCLDPSAVTSRLNDARSAILMSGTLKPGVMYRDLLGLDKERTVIREYVSPFPRKNQLNIIMKNVTTKFEKRSPDEFKKIGDAINGVVESTPGNCALFFSSYKILDEVKPYLDVDKPLLIQEDHLKPSEAAKLIARFKKSADEGAVLAGVTGGSFAEGVDFPGRELLTAVIVGIPLAEPDLETHALIKYYDLKFGKGWEYGYSFPAMSKAVQASGRVIRDEKDRGVIVFMDSRFAWKRYAQCFPKNYDFTITDNPEKEIKLFFKTYN
ncbi:ATP-dependent DNA helicase [Candidatus Micrarchaeota archaeon]|nr:ATP-dependent DNA helicase [Candidatus Micrarchaeota archaeon]